MTLWHDQLRESTKPRREMVAKLYEELKSWRAVGQKLGISRQRAWQIVNLPKKAVPPT